MKRCRLPIATLAVASAFSPVAADRLLTSFESPNDAKGLVLDMTNPRRGKYSGAWEDTTAVDRVVVPVPRDLSAAEGLRVWIQVEGPTTASIAFVLVSENDASEGVDYYQQLVRLDWQGWQEIEIPFASMTSKRSPLGFDAIDELRIASTGYGTKGPTPDLRLKIDELRLYGGAAETALVAPRALAPQRPEVLPTLEAAVAAASTAGGSVAILAAPESDRETLRLVDALLAGGTPPAAIFRFDPAVREDLALLFDVSEVPSLILRDSAGRRLD